MAVIIYTIIAILIGMAIYPLFFRKGKKISNNQELEELKAKNEQLIKEYEDKIQTVKADNENKLAKVEQEFNTQLKEREEENKTASENKTKELKDKFDSLLKEVKEENVKLDRQLKNALDGNIDDTIKEQLDGINLLKKKIKDLEDDLENSEDDLDDLKKKLRNKDADLSELQTNFEKEQKISKQLCSDLTSVKQELEDKVAELDLKMGSLDFIQEILSAKEASSEDIKGLYKKIDFFESFIKGQFLDCNSFLYSTYNLQWQNIEGKAGFEEMKIQIVEAFDQWASTKRKSWLNGKTTIAFVGEFSAGKTSIVNRILSQDDLSVPQLPVSTKATTAIPTYIAGGPVVTYNFVSPGDQLKSISEETFKKVSKELLDQVKGVSSLIKYFVMTYKNPNLNGLSILDTPGFNSNDSEDKERTIDVINECDALFWVFDVNAGTINRSSISLIKEKLNKPLYVVINKVDTKASSEVQKVESLIKSTLSDAGLSVQKYIRFSSKSKLSDIMDPIKNVTKISGRDSFVTDIKEIMEQLQKIFDDSIKLKNKEYNSEFKKGEKITEQFINQMQILSNDCETAHNIPQWTTHLLSKDRFEMTGDEGKNLQSLLDTISNERVGEMADLFDKKSEKAQEIQQSWSDLCDLKAAWQRLDDCFNQFKKVSKNL